MKTSVQQIILFVHAADKLARFVHQTIEVVPIPERNGAAWQELLNAEQAAGTVKYMADQLCATEVTVKG